YPIDWGQVGKDTLFGLGGGAFGYGVGKGLQWAAKTPIGQKVLWKVGGQLRQIPGIKQLSDKGMGFGRYTNTASEARTRHILFGDSPRSGGHHWPAQPPVEVGMQGKTPFPLRWSDDKIMHEISEIANDPTLNWVQQGGKPGATHYKSMKPMRYAVDVERHGLHFRVVTEPLGEGVITGYLTQRPPLGPGALAVRNEFALATTHIDD
ncbi:EndoU domain-containing protein, partial [Schaalia canis]